MKFFATAEVPRFAGRWVASWSSWSLALSGGLASALLVGLLGVALNTSLLSQLCACAGGEMVPLGTDKYSPLLYGDRPTVAQLSALGRQIFSDPRYSASGKQSCASCHDPSHAYGPPNALAVQPGGPRLDRFGFRNTPSLTYVHAPIAFTAHFFETEVTQIADDQGPTGGRTWDGRVNTGHDQALMPLMDPNEMANPSREAIVDKLRASPYAQAFREAVSAPGEDVFDDPEQALAWVTIAIEAFEQSPADFHPFTSKYDAYLRDEARLTPQEHRGLMLFNDMKKGNCMSCHPSGGKGMQGRFPIFTDFGYAALGVPRNRELPANRDPAFFDLGLCGPFRTDFVNSPEACGRFRAPSLRNVAQRQRFFHNGAIRSLRDAVAFYATRDTQPQRWYPRGADGQVTRFDDLPARYRANVEAGIPFKPTPDGRPRLSSQEVDDIVAFLKTLSDGYARPAR